MSSRRQLLSQLAAASACVLPARAWSDDVPAAGNTRSLRILILGGTGRIGPFFVRAAVARGHRVAVFSRGRAHADLPASVERLIGDRNANLDAIARRDWDAVLDLATYGPAWVRSLGRALNGHVGHYTFVSTISVYADPATNKSVPETSKLLVYHGTADPYGPVNDGVSRLAFA